MLYFSVVQYGHRLKPLSYLWPVKSLQHHVIINKYFNNYVIASAHRKITGLKETDTNKIL